MNHLAPGAAGGRQGRLAIRSSQAVLLALALGVAWAPPARGHDPSNHVPNAPAIKAAGPAVTVEFQAEVQGGLPWSVRPDRRVVRARRGESVRVVYRTRNSAERPTAGKAVHAVEPGGAEAHLDLVECFCFVQATLGAGEERTFPATVYVRPTLASSIRRVLLRYTFAPDAAPAPPPPAGTLEVWVGGTASQAGSSGPPHFRVMSVGIEGEAGAGLTGWFHFPVRDGSLSFPDAARRPAMLLRSPAPAGTYRALRLQVAPSAGPGGRPSADAVVGSAPAPVAFTIPPGGTTVITLELTVREVGDGNHGVHVRATTARLAP